MEVTSREPYKWITFYDFPMGFGIYRTFDQIISSQVEQGSSKNKTTELVLNICKAEINSGKYLSLLSDSDWTPRNKKLPTTDGLVDKNENTQFPILTNTPPKGSKFISKERMSSLKMTPTDYFVSISLIGQDLKTNLKNQGRDNWLLYRMLLSRKLDDFNKYIQNGGSNDDYYLTLFVAKIFSLVENKVISQEALSNSKLGSKPKLPFKEKDIDDLSLDKQSKEKVKKELKIFFE